MAARTAGIDRNEEITSLSPYVFSSAAMHESTVVVTLIDTLFRYQLFISLCSLSLSLLMRFKNVCRH